MNKQSILNAVLTCKTAVIISFVAAFAACKNGEKSKQLFTQLSPHATHITFTNELVEDAKWNILSYEYIYNGTGVAAGDLNGDGLPDLYFTGNAVPNKLYLNKGGLAFEDITTRAGVAGRNHWKTGVTMADVNGDSKLDIYVCYSGPGENRERRNELYINQGNQNGIPVFKEQAVQFGLDAEGTFSTQCVFFDFDRDGDLDAFLVNHADMFYNPNYNTAKLRTMRHSQFGNRLYRNDNGKFADISELAGIYGGGLNFGLGVSVSDVNNDNWPDIYVSNDYHEQDFLYLNNHDGTFKEVLKQSTGHISKYSMGNDIDDYNNDLLPDIFTMDMLPENNRRQKLLKGPDGYDIYMELVRLGFHHQNMRNMLQLNMGLNKDSIPIFSEIGQLAGISNTDWSWTPLLADYDNDGWKDLYVTNGYLRDFTNLDFLKYRFAEAQEKAKKEKQPMDTLGLIKQLGSTKISNYAFANNQHLGFTNKTKEWGLDELTISTGATYADLDNDGDLDLIVCNTNQPVSVFRNNNRELSKNHFLKIKLKGSGNNTNAIGAKVVLITKSTKQFREMYTTKGFQSSTEPVIQFGLGRDSLFEKLQISWPNGLIAEYYNGKADTLLNITYNPLVSAIPEKPAIPDYLFSAYTRLSGIEYSQQENRSFVDFKSQFLLPYQVSKQGPCLAKADVNGDGLDDVFIGGSANTPAQLYLQKAGEKFVLSSSRPWVAKETAGDGAAVFFDADGDKDMDLFVVKGGAEFPDNSPLYHPKLFINDGKGSFTENETALPPLNVSAGCIAAADYDKDGDTDVFIGGHVSPGKYPVTPFSYLLKNESGTKGLKFSYASDQPEQSLRKPGMVNTAVWADINHDNWPDLIVAGEFMPVTIFENQKGILKNQTDKYGLSKSNGWWFKLIACDIDKDGDLDLIAGNMGLNTQFKATENEPLSMCFNDFDNNGTIDPVLSYYIQGKNYPYNSLDELAEQIPVIKKKFLHYEDYANASFADLFTKEQMRPATTEKIFQLNSCYLENKDGKFLMHALPAEVQFSCVTGIVARDWNNDGNIDLAMSGNFYPWRAEAGKMDACQGWILLGDGKGNFNVQYPAQTGYYTPGDVRNLIIINEFQSSPLLIVARNEDHVITLKRNRK